VLFGHHFAAIAGAGPLVGPVLAAQFGYLPGKLWLIVGVVLAGAVQDFIILFASMRRDGKSLGQMAREEINTTAGMISMVAVLAIMAILLPCSRSSSSTRWRIRRGGSSPSPAPSPSRC
jgi:carbon starvation protein